MIKYILISLVLFSQIEGQQITHTELNKYGGIDFISYFKIVDRGMGIKLIKKVDYYSEGTKFSETNYSEETIYNKQLKDGLMTYWYENGQKKKEGTYKDNNKNGKWTEWYENGQKEYEINFVGDSGGYEDGLGTHWYENGQKRGEYIYKYGQIISSKHWNEDGTVKN